ncbi:MAG: KEOPS complex subunit Pcc1 [Halovenus sp.]
MDHEAVFSLEYSSSERARRVSNAIEPELGAIDDDRSRVRSECSGAELTIIVEARDPTALRAALNTWLSLVGVAERAGNVC